MQTTRWNSSYIAKENIISIQKALHELQNLVDLNQVVKVSIIEIDRMNV